MSKPVWVRWYPKDALDGMQQLSVQEELGYRRVLDLIFVTGDKLVDDDRALGWSTKLGRAWANVKQKLLVQGKLYIDQGFIRNARASETCVETATFIAQRSDAGRRSGDSRRRKNNPRKNQETAATTDELPFERDTISCLNESTNGKRTNQQPTIKDICAKADRRRTRKLPEGFVTWWAAYPNRKSRARAEKAYIAAVDAGVTEEELLRGVRSFRWPEEKWIPHPATWLNDRRWEDEAQPEATQRSTLVGGL